FGSYGPTNRIPGERCIFWLPLIPKARTHPLLDSMAPWSKRGSSADTRPASAIGNTTLAHSGQVSACTRKAVRGESSQWFKLASSALDRTRAHQHARLSRVAAAVRRGLNRSHRYRELRQRALAQVGAEDAVRAGIALRALPGEHPGQGSHPKRTRRGATARWR